MSAGKNFIRLSSLLTKAAADVVACFFPLHSLAPVRGVHLGRLSGKTFREDEIPYKKSKATKPPEAVKPWASSHIKSAKSETKNCSELYAGLM